MGYNVIDCSVGDCSSDGTTGNDCFVGTSDADVIIGNGGNDYVICGDGDDTVDVGTGNDEIHCQGGADIITDSGGLNYVSGGAGEDFFAMGDGADRLFGDADDDTILGGGGADEICGGDNSSTFEDLEGEAGSDQIYGENGDDIMFGGSDADTMRGGIGADEMYGEGGADSMRGGDGDDFVNGGEGADSQVWGENNNDVVVAGSGNDISVQGGAGNDTVYGDEGNETIRGDAGNDSLFGGSGADTLNGGADTDTCKDNLGTVFQNCETQDTPATLKHLASYLDQGRVVLVWDTRSEIGVYGYRLHRVQGDKKQLIFQDVIPADQTSPQGSRYALADAGARPGISYDYELSEVGLNGTESVMGRFTLKAEQKIEEALPLGQQYRVQPVAPASPELAASLRRANVTAASESADAGSPAQAIRIQISETGVYRVTSEMIANILGLSVQDVRAQLSKNGFALTHRGNPVAWIAAAGGNELVFYGQRPSNPALGMSVYNLRPGTGLRMPEANVDVAAANTVTWYTHTTRVEQNRFPALAIAPDPLQDFWMWGVLSSSSETARVFSTEVSAEGLVTGDGKAEIRIGLYGATFGRHGIEVRINGTTIGQAAAYGRKLREISVRVPVSALKENNAVQLYLLPGEDETDVAYINYLALNYPRRSAAIGNQFTVNLAANSQVTVQDFTDPNIALFDVGKPLVPTYLRGAQISSGSSASSIRFASSATQGRAAVLVAPGGYRTPQVAHDYASNIRAHDSCTDYLMVAPRALTTAANELLELRRSQGLKAEIVDIQDIYDEFSYGETNPQALRAFLLYATGEWKCAPRYVVIVGDGSFDYQDIQGMGANWVPPMMMRETELTVAADALFTESTDGSGRMTTALGRLPVQNEEQLKSIIAKIKAYEAAQGEWERQVLLAGDRDEMFAPNRADLDAMAQTIPSSYKVTRYDMNEMDVEKMRGGLTSGLGQGALFFHYLGHGGLEQLGKDNFFSSENVDKLPQTQGMPIVTAFTCLVSRYEIPGYTSLGETLVLSPNRGAIAVFAPGGISRTGLAKGLIQELQGNLYSGRHARLGEAIRESMNAFVTKGGSRDAAVLFQLLGDPALPLKNFDPSKVDENPDANEEGSSDSSGGGCSVNTRVPTSGAVSWVLVWAALCTVTAWRRRRQD